MKNNDWLYQLTKEDITGGNFPLHNILNEALFYPASGFDGDPVRHFSGIFNSFFYVDYTGTEQALENELSTRGFNGYYVFGSRKVSKFDLAPSPWRPKNVLNESGMTFGYDPNKAFCRWMVFEQKGELKHPKRFSLLYLYADGIAAYQATYSRLNLKPKGIAIIQSGHNHGNNWAIFPDSDGLLYKTVSQNTAGMPEYLVYGGFAPIWRSNKSMHRSHFQNAELDLEKGARDFDFNKPCWPEYSEFLGYRPKYDERKRKIHAGYDIMGVLGLWRHTSTSYCQAR